MRGDAEDVREIASRVVELNGRTVALLRVEGEGDTPVVFARGNEAELDMGGLLKRAARATGGRGGGRPDFAQGAGSQALIDEALRLIKEE